MHIQIEFVPDTIHSYNTHTYTQIDTNIHTYINRGLWDIPTLGNNWNIHEQYTLGINFAPSDHSVYYMWQLRKLRKNIEWTEMGRCQSIAYRKSDIYVKYVCIYTYKWCMYKYMHMHLYSHSHTHTHTHIYKCIYIHYKISCKRSVTGEHLQDLRSIVRQGTFIFHFIAFWTFQCYFYYKHILCLLKHHLKSSVVIGIIQIMSFSPKGHQGHI